MADKLIDLLDTARLKYQEYEAEKYHQMRAARTEAEFDAEANTYETRHSFYARELRNHGVEILVRCKDCKHLGWSISCPFCYKLKYPMSEAKTKEHFCSYGERREEE